MEKKPDCTKINVIVSILFFIIILYLHVSYYPTLLKIAKKKLRNNNLI